MGGEEAMRTFQGKVASGSEHMSKRMAAGGTALRLYEEFTGLELIPGSLNIDLGQEVDMPEHAERIMRKDHDGEATIYISPAFVNDLPVFAVRNKLAEEGEGQNPKNIIEIISDYRLRDELHLEDGDPVTVRF